MAFEEFQSFGTKPSRRSPAVVVALIALLGLGLAAVVYWYGLPAAGVKPLATAELTRDAEAPAQADTPSANAKSEKTAAAAATTGQAAPAGHSGKPRSQAQSAAKTSSANAPAPSGASAHPEGEPLPTYAPAASTVQLARAPADPRQYDRTNTEVTAPVLLTPLSHVPLPPEIRREASSTDVAIQVMVNEEGTVDFVKATVSPRTLAESILVYNGLSIAKTWRFRPASRNGGPVKYRLLVPLSMF